MKIINRYIEENGIIFNKKFIYEDKYSASKKPKSSNIDDENPFTRKGLNELLADAKLHRFDTVLVSTHDRLTRNMQESLLLKFFFKKLKVDLFYCKPGENLDTESEKLNIFFDNLLNNLSALESNIIGSRTRLGNEYNIKKGFWAGGPSPYGYKLEKIHPSSRKSILRISYSEANIVRKIFNLYLEGLSPSKIAERIKGEYKYNMDRKWTKNSIISILKNEDYTGVMVWDKKGGARNPIKHKNPITSTVNKENIIIEPELWEQVEKIRTIQEKQPKFFSTPFLLNGYLVCGKCGKAMRTKNNGGKKGRVYYCLKEKESWETCIAADEIEEEVIKALGMHLTLTLRNEENFNTFYEKYKTDFDSKKVTYEKSFEELQSKISENNRFLAKCDEELAKLKGTWIYEEDKYKENLDFTESLNELYSYLKINENILNKNRDEISQKNEAKFLDKETLKKFILDKKNLLDSLESKTEDKESYRRGLKILIYDLVDEIIYNDDKTVDLIIK